MLWVWCFPALFVVSVGGETVAGRGVLSCMSGTSVAAREHLWRSSLRGAMLCEDVAACIDVCGAACFPVCVPFVHNRWVGRHARYVMRWRRSWIMMDYIFLL